MALLGSLLVALASPVPARALETVINTSPFVYDNGNPIFDTVQVYDQGCLDASCSSSPTLVDVVDPADTTTFWIWGQSEVRFLGGTVTVARAHADSTVELLGTALSSVILRDRALALHQSGYVTTITLEGNLTDTTRLELNGGNFGTVNGRRIADITMNSGFGDWMDLQGWWAGTFTMNGGTLQSLSVSQQGLPVDTLVRVRGGTVANGLSARANTRFVVTGGSIPAPVTSYYSGYVTVKGGSGITEFRTFGLVDEQDALIEVWGSDFEVDGAPVPYGDVVAESGTLTGTLMDGSPLSAAFLTNGAGSSWYGTIRLMQPPEVPAASTPGLAVLAALLAGAALYRLHRQRFPRLPD